jgi:thiol-disulfide isomerase/thioredoxin
MRIRLNLISLLLFGLISNRGHAQRVQAPSLNIGDTAPTLKVQAWLKGAPIEKFEKERVYVIEFWATWCKPCIAAMPHLSALADEYKNKVTFIGIDSYEQKTTSAGKIKSFVDSMGHRMDYHVAAQNSDFMVVDWLRASLEQGIPKTFVINGKGQVAWIGHPHELDKVLHKIVNNNWDIKQALADRNENKYLDSLDEEVEYILAPYRADPLNPDDPGKPDSALVALDEMLRKEPRLKFMPAFAAFTFVSLLQTNPHKAYAFGKEILAASTYEEDLYSIIYGNLEAFSSKLQLAPEIYRLGIEAFQAQIARYPETTDLPRAYHRMAEWYRRTGEK